MFPILFLFQYSSCRQLQKHWIQISDQGKGSYRSRVQKCASSKRRCMWNKLLSRTQLRVLQLRSSRKWNSSMPIEHSKSPTSLQRRLCIESRIYLPLYCGENVILAAPYFEWKTKAKACGFSFGKPAPSRRGQLAIRHCAQTLSKTWQNMDAVGLPFISSPCRTELTCLHRL